jgi:hypothetical protein
VWLAVVLAVFVAGAPAQAEACVCMDFSTEERFDGADLVFEGTIVAEHPPHDGRPVLEFDVEAAWKGVDVGEHVIVHSGIVGTCGPGFEAAPSWIVFAHRSDGGPDWALPAGAISGSTACGSAVSSDHAADLRAELDAIGDGGGCAVDRSRADGPIALALMMLVVVRRRSRSQQQSHSQVPRQYICPQKKSAW